MLIVPLTVLLNTPIPYEEALIKPLLSITPTITLVFLNIMPLTPAMVPPLLILPVMVALLIPTPV